MKFLEPIEKLLKHCAFSSLIFMSCLGAVSLCESLYGSTNPCGFQECDGFQNVECCSPACATVSVEYLYWKVEAELYAGQYLDYSVDDTGAATIDGRLQRQKFDFTSGVRVGLGYALPYENYDLGLSWTWLNPKTTTNLFTTPIAPSTIQIAVALELIDETGEDIEGTVGSLSSVWNMNFNMFDLKMGREFFVGRRFALHPTLGVKGGWIDHTQVFVFNDVPIKNVVGTRLPNTQGFGKKTNKFGGAGPLVGLDMRYGFGPQFGLFGSVSGALLYGHFTLNNTFFLGNTFNEIPQTAILNNSHNRLSSTIQMLIGGDWSYRLWGRGIHLGAAYEVQLWKDQLGANDSSSQFSIVTYRSGGDLMMQGLTLQAAIDF